MHCCIACLLSKIGTSVLQASKPCALIVVRAIYQQCLLQTLVLNVEGRVLTPDQMRAGLFVLPSEAALASRLLQEGAWRTPSIPLPSTSEQSLGEPLFPLYCSFCSVCDA